MNDPSGGVPQQLLPHVHLLSSFRFPTVAHMSVETIVDYLLQAPNITRSTAPMNWTYLEAPGDGTVLLVWQPPQLATHFASDGFVWADPEQAFSLDAKGYTVEMYVHRSGFHPPHEPIASHCRRRYRLTASKSPTPNASIDPSLWLVHYAACEDNARIPANRIPVAPQTQHVLSTRRFLQTQGQLIRKEFMLHDRNNWPTINLPGSQMPGYPQQPPMYPMAQQPTRPPPPPQGPPYYPQQPPHAQPSMGPSPAKRPRQTPPTHMPGSGPPAASAMALPHDPYFDEEEDTSRGDLLDHLTPREIAMVRYKQHHEWMEEILSSPYNISQIISGDLGLGLEGELEALTKDIFEPPNGETAKRRGTPGRVGKLGQGKAEEFTKRVEESIAKNMAEMDRKDKLHRQRLAELLDQGKRFKDWEARLRNAESDPTSTGPEVWRLEGHIDSLEDGEDPEHMTAEQKPKESVDDIAKEVEAAIGRSVGDVPEVCCRQFGGLLDNQTAEKGTLLDFAYPHAASNENGDGADVDMNNSAAGLLDPVGNSSTSTPADTVPTPSVDQPASTVAVPAAGGPATTMEAAAGDQAAVAEETLKETASDEALANLETPIPAPADLDVDVEMAGVPDDHAASTELSADVGAAVNEGGDWVLVDKATTPNLETAAPTEPAQEVPAPAGFSATSTAPAQPAVTATATAAATEDTALDASAAIDTAAALDSAAFGDFGDLDGTDTAGEALAGLDMPDTAADDLGLGDAGAFGLEDSAFGDAFLGTEGAGTGEDGGGE